MQNCHVSDVNCHDHELNQTARCPDAQKVAHTSLVGYCRAGHALEIWRNVVVLTGMPSSHIGYAHFNRFT